MELLYTFSKVTTVQYHLVSQNQEYTILNCLNIITVLKIKSETIHSYIIVN